MSSGKWRPSCLGLNELIGSEIYEREDIYLSAILREIIKVFIIAMNLKITDLRLHIHLPDTNKLILIW